MAATGNPQPLFRNHSDYLLDFKRRRNMFRFFASLLIVTLIALQGTAFLLRFGLFGPSGATTIFYQHFVRLSLDNAKNNFQQPSVVKPKTVLLWTKFFSNSQWSDHFLRNGGPSVDVTVGASSFRCHFTTNRSFFDEADAVVFHARDLDFQDVPERRLARQRFVFFLIEAPTHSGFNEHQWRQANEMQFNWTMSYSTHADVFFPYGQIRSSPPLTLPQEASSVDQKIANFTSTFWQRPKDAVWIVSNCMSFSRREQIIKRLENEGISLDVWGFCALRRPDDEWRTGGGETAFFSKYRFVLAFENSLCDDYVTEKAFHAFYANFIAGPIPVIYGSGNYSTFFQKGSYIDARQFQTIAELARTMKAISSPNVSQSLVSSYYQWHKTVNPRYEPGYEVDLATDNYILDNYKRAGWRNLCQKLWQASEDDLKKNDAIAKSKTSTVEDLRKTMGKCYSKIPFSKELYST